MTAIPPHSLFYLAIGLQPHCQRMKGQRVSYRTDIPSNTIALPLDTAVSLLPGEAQYCLSDRLLAGSGTITEIL